MSFSEGDWGLRSVNFNPFRFSLWFLFFLLLRCRSICTEWNLIGGDEFPLNSFGTVGSIVVPVCSNPQTICNLWLWLGFVIHCETCWVLSLVFRILPEKVLFVGVCFWGPNTAVSAGTLPNLETWFFHQLQPIRHRKVYCQHLSTPQGWAWPATMSISYIISWLINILYTVEKW